MNDGRREMQSNIDLIAFFYASIFLLLLLQMVRVCVSAKALAPHFHCGITLAVLCLSESDSSPFPFDLLFPPSSIMKNDDTFRC